MVLILPFIHSSSIFFFFVQAFGDRSERANYYSYIYHLYIQHFFQFAYYYCNFCEFFKPADDLLL